MQLEDIHTSLQIRQQQQKINLYSIKNLQIALSNKKFGRNLDLNDNE